jgi:hypothetical protein
LTELGVDDDAPAKVEGPLAALPHATIRSQPALEMHGRLPDWVADLRRLKDAGETVIFVAGTSGRAERTIELLKEYGLLAVPAFQRFRRRVDYTEMGGAPLLGIDGAAVISHGSSPPKAIKNAVRVAAEWAKAGLNDHIKAALDLELTRSQREGSRE